MKIILVVLTEGKMKGKSIPITQAKFVIGRDPECQLRPASAAISKQHCVLRMQGERAFLRDLASTNGTFLNERQIMGEIELHDGDLLRIGPLEFSVTLSSAKQSPKAAISAPKAGSDDEEAAKLLLALEDEEYVPDSPGVDSEGIPTGSTELGTMPAGADTQDPPSSTKLPATKQTNWDTSSAARSLLSKYRKRRRS